MQRLYSASGASDVEIESERYSDEEWARIRLLLKKLLLGREKASAVRLLDRLPWTVVEATNHFKDEFGVLYARLPLDQYVDACALEKKAAARTAAADIASALTEIEPERTHIRHVGFALDTDSSPSAVTRPEPKITSAVIERALNDAEELLRTSGAVSAVDRVHTGLQGYLRVVCRGVGIETDERDGLGALLKKLVAEHPALAEDAPHKAQVTKILRSSGAILDALDPIRNRGSVAHANESLLDEAEAMFVINIGRSLLHYLDARLE
jgi:hypothetical protein